MKKKLVYWGAGKIGRRCLRIGDEKPSYFIDCTPKESIDGIPVKTPEEIEDWQEVFIVITTKYYSDIKEKLLAKNLFEGKDFSDYKVFFRYTVSINTSLESAKKLINSKPEYKGTILIAAPFSQGRRSKEITSFFKKYISFSGQKCICLDLCIGSSYYEVRELFKDDTTPFLGEVLPLPNIAGWDGQEQSNLILDADRNFIPLLSEDELDFITKLEERKKSESSKVFAIHITAKLYAYIKELLSIIKPSGILNWGCWLRISNIIEEIAYRNEIAHRFMEFGFIPGTYQANRHGFAGQCEYAVNSSILLSKAIHGRIDINRIKRYIIEQKIDSGIFKNSDTDQRQLSKLDKKKKTVFFVGMGDAGIGIYGESTYWKNYISSVFKSTFEAIPYINQICQKNDWNFIFKPHPGPRPDGYDEMMRKDRNVIYVTDMEIDKLINLADVVISICSAVDYKVLIYGRPLVSTGHTTLSGKGCVYEVNDMKELERQLAIAIKAGMADTQKECFNIVLEKMLSNYMWDDLTHPDFPYGQSLSESFFST